MPTYYSILTTVGLSKISDAIANSTPLEITQMALGDGNGNTTTPSAGQTALVHQVYREDLSQLITDPENPAYVIAELVVPADEGPFTVREAGLYDSDNDLIAVSNFPETYKPVALEGSTRDLVIRIVVNVSNASAVTLTIDPSVVLATQEYVNTLPNNVTQANGKFFATDKIRARDSGGLGIEDDGGNTGVFVKDGGFVGINNTNPQYPLDARVNGSILGFTQAGIIMAPKPDTDIEVNSLDIRVESKLTSKNTALKNTWSQGLGWDSGSSSSTAFKLTSKWKGVGDDDTITSLYTVNSAGSMAELLTLYCGDKIGIKIPTPLQALHILGGILTKKTSNGTIASPISQVGVTSECQDADNPVGVWFKNTHANTHAIWVEIKTCNDAGTSDTRVTIDKDGKFLPGADNTYDIGSGSLRFKDIYAGNATINTSDERLKNSIASNPLGLDFVNLLRPVSYKWANTPETKKIIQRQKTEIIVEEVEEITEENGKFVLRKVSVERKTPAFEYHSVYDETGEKVFDEVPTFDEDGNVVKVDLIEKKHKVPIIEEVEVIETPAQTYNRRHYGLIAQEVLSVLEQLNIETTDFAPLVYDESSDRYGLRYEELISILIKAIQELTTRVEELEGEI